MSQKIVIKANVKREPQDSVVKVSYEWNWRRIVSTAMLMIMTCAAIIYGLTASVNADQDEHTNELQSSLSVSSIPNVDVEPEGEVNNDIVTETLATEISIKSQLQRTSSVANEVDDSVLPPATDLAMLSTVPEPLAVVERAEPERATKHPKPVGTELSLEQNTLPHKVLAEVDSDSDTLTSKQGFAPLAKIASVALGAQIDTDKISRAVLTRSVSNREPINVFAADIRLSQFNGSLSFFSELKNLQGQHVKHVWVFAGKKMAEIELSVTSPRYRTYSTKHISDSQVGHWRVDVIDEQGLLIAQKEFRVLAD